MSCECKINMTNNLRTNLFAIIKGDGFFELKGFSKHNNFACKLAQFYWLKETFWSTKNQTNEKGGKNKVTCFLLCFDWRVQFSRLEICNNAIPHPLLFFFPWFFRLCNTFIQKKITLSFLHHWPYKTLVWKMERSSENQKVQNEGEVMFTSEIEIRRNERNWKKPKFANRVLQIFKIEWKNLQFEETKNWTNFGTIASSWIFVSHCCIACPLNSCHCGIPNNKWKNILLGWNT